MSNLLAIAVLFVTLVDIWVYRGLTVRIRRLEDRLR
jgi:hypothetical protein